MRLSISDQKLLLLHPVYPDLTKEREAVVALSMVADTGKWEQSAAFALDVAPAVARWVKNDHLGLAIPYRKRNIQAKYYPNFIAVLDRGLQLIIEVKGQYDDDADRRAKAAARWVAAVNRSGEHGPWHYVVVEDPQELEGAIRDLARTERAFAAPTGSD